MAFFLEAGFLGLLVYGEGRVGKRTMMFATCMVSLGTILSVTWILVANSWMQTPAGYKQVDGQFQAVDWLHVIFNPSFGIRFVHMLVGALIAAAWFIAGVSAWYLLKRRYQPMAHRGLSIALGVLSVLVPVQIFIGFNVVQYVVKYKGAEALAMEGNWKPNTGYNLLEIPNQNGPGNHWQVTIPWLGSAISQDWSGHTAIPPVTLLPKKLRPDILTTFYGFRAMWYGAVLMLGIALVGILLRLRGRLYSTGWFHKVAIAMVPTGSSRSGAAGAGRDRATTLAGVRQAADRAGGLAAQTGRGAHDADPVFAVYLALLGTYVWYVIRAVRQGPGPDQVEPATPPLVAPQAPVLSLTS